MDEKRVSKHWNYNPKLDITEFNLEELNASNLVNELLVLKQSDVSFTFMMNLFGNFNGKSMCHQYDTFDIPPHGFVFKNAKGKEVSNTSKITTTIGIWIFNVFFLRDFGFSYLFGGYVNENLRADDFGDINQTLVYALAEDKIEVAAYKKFLDYSEFFMPFETILASNHTEKILTCTKAIDKKKKEFIKAHKEEIESGNVAIVEQMEKELLDFAKEYLGDDAGLDAYDSGAGGSFKNNFKNMYIMKGAIRNPDPNAKQEYNIALSNYIDGICADEYTLIANSLAAGPYSRSKKTELGGYWEKLIVAALSSVTIDEPDSDCGTNKYIETVLTDDLIDAFIYSYIIKPDGSLEELTSDNIDKYRNKKVKVRSTLFCKNKNGKVGHHCAGNFFYRRGNKNIGLAVSQIATRLKLTSMKAFHNSTVTTAEIEPLKAFRLN